MKKIIITLSVVVLIIALYIVWMNLQQSGKTKQVENPITQETAFQETSSPENINPVDEAWKDINLKTVIKKGETFDLKQEPQYKVCMEQSINMCISQTVAQVVQRDQNPDVCEVLESPQQIESCKNNLYLQLASLEQDTSLCLKIGDMRTQINCQNSIYRNQAIAASDEQICDKILLEDSQDTWDENQVNREINECKQSVQRDIEFQETRLELIWADRAE